MQETRKESLIIPMPKYIEIAILVRETRAQKMSASAGDERSNYFQTFLISCPFPFGRYKLFLLCAPVSYLNRVEYFRGDPHDDGIHRYIPVKKHLAYQFHGTTRCIAGNPAWWVVFLFLDA